MKLPDIRRASVVSLLLLVFAGCGNPGGSLVDLKGKLSLNGQPVAGATLKFVPIGNDGYPANAYTGSNGEFKMSTYSTGDGIRKGSYKVLVTKGAEPAKVDINPNDGESMKKMMMGGGMVSKPDPAAKKDKKKETVIPAIYNTEASPLRCTVPVPGGVFNLELSDSGS